MSTGGALTTAAFGMALAVAATVAQHRTEDCQQTTVASVILMGERCGVVDHIAEQRKRAGVE